MGKLDNVIVNPIYVGKDNKDGWECFKWDVGIHYGRNVMEIPYYMGLGLAGIEPSLEDVMTSLSLDSLSTNMSFDDFCSEFGYDNDSIKALKLYEQCKEDDVRLRKLFGEDYDEIMEEVAEIEQ